MSQVSGPGPTASCAACGAPDDGEFVNCRYCKHAVSAEALARAIPCPNPACRIACRWGKQKCAACQAWIVVSCVFCGSISPHNISNCLCCNEAFAGAAVGASVGSHHHGGYYYSNSNEYYSPPSSNDYDVSNVVDDIGDSFSDD